MTSTTSPAAITWADESRRAAFERWLADVRTRHPLDPATLRSASSDASFRRYFRIDAASGTSFVIMDAPPPQEDVRPFVAVAELLHGAGLNAPRVIEQDAAQGFLLLSDLGSRLYLTELHEAVACGATQTVDLLMREAIAALVQWQSRADASGLPPYDDALLRRELALFPDWCVTREFGIAWTPAQQQQWQASCDLLVRSALAQPTVAVHRDYMPRNLMLSEPNPGILDFQDAVRGPISYDVASLLRDAFISWEEEREIDWAVRYWQSARQAGLPVEHDFGEFWRQLEWMGLQRHLKVLGIFCRLKHRDAKPKYSEDLPRFFAYAHRVTTRYNGLGPLARLLEPLMGTQRVDAYY
ncbi:phosphotransferase [uncultured Piscinibacter sp.]|uniref:aminoglycoside phosphotransferase family protein n=1 Tax=uncultured Piscinibacter sp. TaxID=1131835 RepID=UPI00261ECC8C|nr:phosphotransferase [uncultured Piscinibacter sp.]